jgi:hypothetical protein
MMPPKLSPNSLRLVNGHVLNRATSGTRREGRNNQSHVEPTRRRINDRGHFLTWENLVRQRMTEHLCSIFAKNRPQFI